MYYEHYELTPSSTSPATAYVFSPHSPLNIVTSSIPKMSSEIGLIKKEAHCQVHALGRMADELEGTRQEVTVASKRYYPSICQEGLRKSTKNLSGQLRFRALPEYNSPAM